MESATVDWALDAAAIVMESGGTTALAERTFDGVLAALTKGAESPAMLGSVWRTDFVAATLASPEDGSTSVLRRVPAIGLSLTRATKAAGLGERVARGELNADAIAGEIDRIRKLPAPYGRATIVLASGCAAAFLTQTVEGDAGSIGVAFVAAACGAFLRSLLQGRKAERSACTFAGAILSGLIATAGIRLGLTSSVAATLLGSIIYMVPGIALATGFVDLVSDRHMMPGVERILSGALTFFILALSLVIADALL